MNAFTTTAALTVLAATTVALAAQTGPDSDIGAQSDAALCQLKREAMKDAATSTAFAATAAQDGMVEVALAGLALRKSDDNELRQFAQQMVQDYAQSNERVGLDRQVRGPDPANRAGREAQCLDQKAQREIWQGF